MTHDDAVATHAAERYLLEEMSEAERHDFEAHYFDCPPCAEDVRLGAAMADAVRTGSAPAEVVPFAAPARPAGPVAGSGGTPGARPALASASSRSTWWALAAAAALAVLAGYQSFVVIPGLRGDGAQALAPVVLRPVSRGELPTVHRPAGGGLLSLAMDVNVDPAPDKLIYHLRTDAGSEVLTGEAPVPQPGTPLLLVIPGRDLSAGRYVLSLVDPSNPSAEVGTYRFDVD
ncbi:MAG: zf-HC2 domain-containing protein [Vicinamibacterales bacterium]